MAEYEEILDTATFWYQLGYAAGYAEGQAADA